MTNKEIIQRGILIRDETEPAQNTSERVGGVIEGIGRNLADKDTAIAAEAARNGYYQCTVNNNQLAVTAPGFTLPAHGGNIRIKMSAPATGACTLNINSTGPKTLLYNGAALSSANTWEKDEIISVFYDPSGSGQYLASNSQGGGGKAEKIKYDNSQSGLSAENVQGALDEIVDFIPVEETPVSYPASVSGVEFGADGNWVSRASRWLKFIPYSYSEGETLKITTGQNNCVFAFLTSNSHVAGQQIPYCQGMTSSYVVANSTKTFVIPSDCSYICVYAAWSSTSVLPESMSIVSRHIITEEELDESIESVRKELPTTIKDLTLYKAGYVVNTAGSIATSQYTSAFNIYKTEILSATQITIKSLILSQVNGGWCAGAFYDKNMQYIANSVIDARNMSRADYVVTNQTISVPENAVYLLLNSNGIIPSIEASSEASTTAVEQIGKALGLPELLYFKKTDGDLSLIVQASSSFLNANGVITQNQYSTDYTVLKLTGFSKIIPFNLTTYLQGTGIPCVCAYDSNGVMLKKFGSAPTSGRDVIVPIDLSNYQNTSYLLINVYKYSEHPMDVSSVPVIDIRYPDYEQKLKEELYNQLLPLITEKRSISIFFIGNSLTQDTIGYLPIILKEIAPEIEFKFYDWYNSGAKLEQQYAKFINNQPCESFSKCENVISWTNIINTVTINDILSNYDFDIVCLQEYSYFDFTESQLITNFNNIVSFISEHYAKPLKYVCLIDQPNRSKVSAMYAQSVSYAKTFLKSTVCEDILNPGGALFLALQTSLDSLGDQGHLSPDGTHAQEGLPCVLQSYVHALWILDKLGVAKSIYNSQTRITAENYPSINVPGPNLGTGVVEGTDAQYRIAQQCAIKAYKLSRKYVNEVLETLPETI